MVKVKEIVVIGELFLLFVDIILVSLIFNLFKILVVGFNYMDYFNEVKEV